MTTRIRTSWPAAWITLAALLVAGAIALGLPAAAHAGTSCIPTKYTNVCAPQKVEQTQLAPLSHTGWVYLNLNYCAAQVCTAQYAISTAAWKWTGKAWATGSINGGWVYVAPFGAGFRWAFTAESGWVALSSGRFEIRAY